MIIKMRWMVPVRTHTYWNRHDEQVTETYKLDPVLQFYDFEQREWVTIPTEEVRL